MIQTGLLYGLPPVVASVQSIGAQSLRINLINDFYHNISFRNKQIVHIPPPAEEVRILATREVVLVTDILG